MGTDFDILIVGAGPAGLSTWLHLARLAPELAARTVILEQAHHPRPKLCAGGVLPGAEVYLRRLGLDMRAVASAPVHEIIFQFESCRPIVRHEPVCFRAVRREEFDAWLADAARQRGLAMQEGVRVQGVVVQEGRALVTTSRGTLTSRVVVGADGAKSVVRRAVAGRAESQLARLLEVRPPSDPPPGIVGPGQAIFDFSWIAHGVQGYVWDFPAPPDGQRVRTWGVYDSRVNPRIPAKSLKPTLEAALARAGRPLGETPLEGYPFRRFGRGAPLAAPHILLVGDAAGADSLVGEGISFALGYGEVAAATLRDAFLDEDFSFGDYRRRVLRHRSGRYLRRRAWVAYIFYHMRNRALIRLVWPLAVTLMDRFFVDWGDGG